MNSHEKSELCSSRNEWVMLNFVIWQPFCFSKFCQNLFRLSIRTSMWNLDFVAQEMSELCSIVQFGGHFIFWQPFCLSKFVQTVHTNFYAKSGLCSSRNERVMLNFAIWWPFFFAAILFFKILSKFVQTVHMNFHAKSGVCSSKNERVMALGTKEDGHLSISPNFLSIYL